MCIYLANGEQVSHTHTHQVLNVKLVQNVVFLFVMLRLPGSPNHPNSSAGNLGMRLDRSVYHLKQSHSQTIFPSVCEK